ncbi:MAG TPA: hypothetical protein DIV86_06380 [Alphaproteobacteria bacterium]|nr:hypothetical protein [Alphaproteobacteria bacterium]
MELDSGDGDDDIFLKGNPDSVFRINSGAGNDRIWAGHITSEDTSLNGTMYIDSGSGNDYLAIKANHAEIRLGNGNDSIYLTGESSLVYGEEGDDYIYGGNGADEIYGGSGNDNINGGGGDDVIYGGDGNDMINGGDGNDIIYGGEGINRLFGGNGNDILVSGTTSHYSNGLYGGDGNDIFIINFQQGFIGDSNSFNVEYPGTEDVFIFNNIFNINTSILIGGFETADRLDFSMYNIDFNDLTFVDVGDAAVNIFYNEGKIQLDNYSTTDLTIDNFIF